jgi:hypothetical protein
MRRTMLAVTIVALSLPVSAAEYEFYGTYRLISTTRTVLDTGQIITFHGETGFITYGKDRRMMTSTSFDALHESGVCGCRPWEPQPHPASAGVGKPAMHKVADGRTPGCGGLYGDLMPVDGAANGASGGQYHR